MSENIVDNPNGKVLFAVDYFNLMRYMEIPQKGEEYDESKRWVVDAVIKLFLLQWDFSIPEIDEANKVFWGKVNTNTLDENISTVLDRIVEFIKDDKKAQEKLLIEVLAVAQMDNTLLENEKNISNYLQKQFDLRPSEFDQIIKIGWDWQTALNFLGNKFIEYYNNQDAYDSKSKPD